MIPFTLHLLLVMESFFQVKGGVIPSEIVSLMGMTMVVRHRVSSRPQFSCVCLGFDLYIRKHFFY